MDTTLRALLVLTRHNNYTECRTQRRLVHSDNTTCVNISTVQYSDNTICGNISSSITCQEYTRINGILDFCSCNRDSIAVTANISLVSMIRTHDHQSFNVFCQYLHQPRQIPLHGSVQCSSITMFNPS